MAVMGTFSSFTTATLAIYASQSSLNVTGNNIANINTRGYTRQRMDLCSLYNTGQARYANAFNLNIGYGVLCESVNQLRDPFLDIRYRNENSSLGAQEAKLKGLQQISHILDEVGRGEEGFGVIEDQLGDFISKLESWNDDSGVENYEKLVAGSASTLTKLFNSAAKELQTVFENEEKYLEESVTKVNGLLNQIRDLNEQIRAHAIYGDNALELRDARNVAIDELSSLIKIDVTYSMERVDQFTEIEKLTITIPGTEDPAMSKAEAIAKAIADGKKPDADGNYDLSEYNYSSNFGKPIKLIDGIYGTQLNIKKEYTLNPKREDPAYNDQLKPGDPGYEPKYLDAFGEPTDDEGLADFVYDDKYLMDLDPLVDKRGFYMKDPKYGNKLRSSVDLKDTDLYGAIQSMRELLTEEGEFSSSDELGIGSENWDKEISEELRKLLVMDPAANKKRGIPYYMKALDNLAQQFARELNKINQPNQYAKKVSNNTGELILAEDELTYDMIYKMDDSKHPDGTPVGDKHFADKDGEPLLKYGATPGSTNPADFMGIDDVKYANIDPVEPYQVQKLDANGDPMVDANGKPVMEYVFTDANGNPDMEAQTKAIQEAQKNLEILREKGQLTEEWDFYKGGVLISNNGNNNDPTNITAANISVSQDWATGAVQVLRSVQPNDIFIDENGQKKVITHTSEGDNIQHMISSLQGKREFYATHIDADSNSRSFYFRGNFQEFFTNISGTLADDTNITGKLYDNFDLAALKLENDRQSVSGVDLNEEATSMMQFQKSYSAACQLLTTLDSMLDKLINGTIR